MSKVCPIYLNNSIFLKFNLKKPLFYKGFQNNQLSIIIIITFIDIICDNLIPVFNDKRH